jgi:peroxiredoxin family protein
VLRVAFIEAILKKRGALVVDFPNAAVVALTRADEKFFGEPLPYCYSIPVESILDWKYGEDGELEWVILHEIKQERATPDDVRDKKHSEFKIWRREGDQVYWDLYKTEPYDDNHPIKPDTEVPLVDSGTTTFLRIPIIFIEIPDGLWVGNKVGPGSLEHFQRRSTLVCAENRSLVTIPYVKLGPEMTAPGDPMPSEASQDPSRGDDMLLKFQRDGFLVLGSGDDIAYAEPKGKSYGIVSTQLTELKDEMFRVAHQMAASVSNRPSSLSRSGDSKEEDRRVEAIVLGAYADIMRPVAARIYETIAHARGDNVFWTVHGLDNFEKEDRGRLVTEATQMQVIGIPSVTFKKTYITQLAVKLIAGAPAETVEQIRREIADAVEAGTLSDVPGDMESGLSAASGEHDSQGGDDPSNGHVNVEVIDYADATGQGNG